LPVKSFEMDIRAVRPTHLEWMSSAGEQSGSSRPLTVLSADPRGDKCSGAGV
jgi:hypothetical protein